MASELILGSSTSVLREAMVENESIMRALIADAEVELSKGDIDAAIVLAQAAAAFAWRNHCGTFSSTRLESIAWSAGRSLKAPVRQTDPLRGSTVHVATELYPTGGHGKLLSRWLAAASGRHDLVLTRQGRPVPQDVVDVVRDRGGMVRVLDARSRPSQRARTLRTLVGQANEVVLHTHPYDLIAIAALADGDTVTTLVNHADHVFWVGASVADRVISIRHSGDSVVGRRRGVPAPRRRVLPLPIARRKVERRKARQDLGLEASDVVILTMAARYKFLSRSGYSFLDLMGPILRDLGPKVHLLMVGGAPMHSPSSEIVVLPETSNPDSYFSAADIYLDSHPMASLTSTLEAAAMGLPVVSLCQWPPEASVLCTDSPGLNGVTTASNDYELQTALDNLVRSAATREEQGDAAAESVARHNSPSHWAALAPPSASAPLGLTGLPAPRLREPDALDLGLLAVGQVNPGRQRALQSQVRLASSSTRARVWVREALRGQRLSLSTLLSENMVIRLSRMRGA